MSINDGSVKIIAGKYRNRILKSFKGQSVRPTSGIVKKSLFEIIQPLKGKTVLDLFSGTGSLGIESLSRGASSATFVEKNRKVFKILLENIKTICAEDKIYTLNRDVSIFLKSHNKKYDIILADPPYGLFEFDELKLIISDLLNYGGIFCMENKYQKINNEDVRIKNYGKTQVVIWRKKEK